jgi:hypothetical protein
MDGGTTMSSKVKELRDGAIEAIRELLPKEEVAALAERSAEAEYYTSRRRREEISREIGALCLAVEGPLGGKLANLSDAVTQRCRNEERKRASKPQPVAEVVE